MKMNNEIKTFEQSEKLLSDFASGKHSVAKKKDKDWKSPFEDIFERLKSALTTN